MSPRWAKNACRVPRNELLAGKSTPKKFRSWLVMIRTPAPAVKPTTTVCEMKCTARPSRSRPMASIMAPAMNDSVRTRPM